MNGEGTGFSLGLETGDLEGEGDRGRGRMGDGARPWPSTMLQGEVARRTGDAARFLKNLGLVAGDRASASS